MNGCFYIEAWEGPRYSPQAIIPLKMRVSNKGFIFFVGTEVEVLTHFQVVSSEISETELFLVL